MTEDENVDVETISGLSGEPKRRWKHRSEGLMNTHACHPHPHPQFLRSESALGDRTRHKHPEWRAAGWPAGVGVSLGGLEKDVAVLGSSPFQSHAEGPEELWTVVVTRPPVTKHAGAWNPHEPSCRATGA